MNNNHAKCEEEGEEGDPDGKVGEVVAMTDVEGEGVVGIEGLTDGGRDPVLGGLADIATLVDECRSAGIGRTGYTAPGLDGPEPGKEKVLSVAG